MKGYRTLLFNLIAAVAGLIGVHLAPATVGCYADLIVLVLAAGNAVLRFVTTTPVGRSQHPGAEVSLSEIAEAVARRLPKIDPAEIAALLPAPVIAGPANAAPAVDFAAVAESLAKALDGVQAAHAAVTAALPPPVAQAVDPAPQPTAAPQASAPVPQPVPAA